MDILTTINQLEFDEPKVINTKSGMKKILESASPTEEFWQLWKENKEEIKRMGISVSMYNNIWSVNRWKDIDKHDIKEFDQNKKDQYIKSLSNLELKYTKDKLYPYQVESTKKIIHALQRYNGVLDASDTGTGKTFVALAACVELGLRPIVMCPKSIISVWKKACEHFNINDFYVNNYEQYKCNHTDFLNITKIEVPDDTDSKLINDPDKKKKKKMKVESCIWNMPKNGLLIIDECQKFKDYKTINATLLIEAAERNIKILMLSATAASNPMHMKSIGYVLKLFLQLKSFWPWAIAHGCSKKRFTWEFNGDKTHLIDIHNNIFPYKGNRLTIKSIGDAFPDNLILPESYSMNSNTEKIKKIYAEMRKQLIALHLKSQDDNSNFLTIMLRSRQEVELLKIPTLVELTEMHINEGSSVVIFVNFDESVKALSEKLKTNCIVWGNNKGSERDNIINDFQSDKSRIIICNIKAGGVGISLHDINGKYPRVSLISPSFSAQDLVQALGRIHRSGAKSKAIQKIVFCSDTIEERICEKIKTKIANINLLNDGEIQELLF